MGSDVRYICISDLHCGARASLFTPRDGLPDVAEALAGALCAFVGDGPSPRLILLGDVMDLQFSPRATAARESVRVLRALQGAVDWDGAPLVTAGNHDHALWSDARLLIETHVALGRRGAGDLAATPAFRADDAARSRLLDAVLEEAGFGAADLRYPNIGLGDRDRAVLLHHGHFHEAAYLVVTALRDALAAHPRPAPTVASLSAENGGWIDLFWGTLGDAGDSGPWAEDLYQHLLTPTGFRRALAAWSAKIADVVGERVPMGAVPEVRAALDSAARVALGMTLGRMREDERHHEVDALPEDGRAGLARYLGGPTLTQVTEELGGVPGALTYVSGHTHKPYLDRLALPGLATPIGIANTGGWTLNGPRLDNAEGASLALIDGEMNVMMLHAVATPRNGKMPEPRIEGFTDGRAGALAFRAHVTERLAASRDDWTALSQAAHAHYRAIQAELLARTAA